MGLVCRFETGGIREKRGPQVKRKNANGFPALRCTRKCVWNPYSLKHMSLTSTWDDTDTYPSFPHLSERELHRDAGSTMFPKAVHCLQAINPQNSHLECQRWQTIAVSL